MRDTTDVTVPIGDMFKFRSGGWVLLAALAIGILIVFVTLAPALRRIAERPPGDGSTPASYGFALEPLNFPPVELIAAQLHRDMAAPLVNPEPVSPEWITSWAQENRGKYLVSSDPVIGVVIDGQARAFPLGWLGFHEVANDRLGGVPLVIVMHPLSRTIAVYERRIGDREIEFGTSGLMRDSTMMLYARDRAADGSLIEGGGRETLWDPRTGAAVSGPDLDAASLLRRVPFVLTHYGDWLAVHPETTVMPRDEGLLGRYQKATFGRYWAKDDLLFTIAAQPPMPPRRLEACIVLPGSDGAADVVVPASWVEARAVVRPRPRPEFQGGGEPRGEGVGAEANFGPVPTWWIQVDGRQIGLEYRKDPETVTAIAADGSAVEQIHTAWFSWWRTGRSVRFPAPPPGQSLADGLDTFDATPADDAAAAAGAASEG